MALQPSLKPFIVSGSPDAPHTLEFYYCFVCVHSARSAKTLDTIIKPYLEGEKQGKVKVIFRPQVQPWWPSSSLGHEASLAVARVAPEKWWKFALALFDHRTEFTDVPTANLTPPQIREKFVDLGVSQGILSADEGQAAKGLLKIREGGGSGPITDDLKYTLKVSRQNSVHVSPTVLWDGLVVSEVSSSWGKDQWTDFFERKIQV